MVVKNNWLQMSLITAALDELNLDYIPSAGNFICIKVGDADRVDQYLLKNGIITRPVGNYKMAEHLRISLGTSEENQMFINHIKDYFS